MKKNVLLLLILLTNFLSLSAQFPAPQNLNLSIDYIEIDQWGECNGQTVNGPAYCSHFSWNFPDSVSDTLFDYFVIYNFFHLETTKIATTKDTSYVTPNAYIGNLWVTAVYSEPDGESEPSNIVNINELPINIKKIYSDLQSLLHYEPTSKTLTVDFVKNIQFIKIYQLNGQCVLNSTKSINNLGSFLPGIYFVVVTDNNNVIRGEKIHIQ